MRACPGSARGSTKWKSVPIGEPAALSASGGLSAAFFAMFMEAIEPEKCFWEPELGHESAEPLHAEREGALAAG